MKDVIEQAIDSLLEKDSLEVIYASAIEDLRVALMDKIQQYEEFASVELMGPTGGKGASFSALFNLASGYVAPTMLRTIYADGNYTKRKGYKGHARVSAPREYDYIKKKSVEALSADDFANKLIPLVLLHVKEGEEDVDFVSYANTPPYRHKGSLGTSD